MIAFLHGNLVSATPLLAILDVHGVGYEVNIPVTTAEKLPAPRQPVTLFTYVSYREDSQTLFGFAGAEERDFFRLLVEKVSGVGPRVALSIMSKLSLPVLREAIGAGNVTLLAKCPGIGKKTAERLVMELKDKISPAIGESGAIIARPQPAGANSGGAAQDAVEALMALGMRPPDADKAVRKALAALGPNATSEELIKMAFR